MIKLTQTIRRQQPTNCLSVFNHFMGLALKGLITIVHSLQELERVKALLQNKEIAHGKVIVANESLEKEIAKLKENAKKHKEELEAYETKAKWSQNKLKAELESHKVFLVTFRK